MHRRDFIKSAFVAIAAVFIPKQAQATSKNDASAHPDSLHVIFTESRDVFRTVGGETFVNTAGYNEQVNWVRK